ncbi:DUF3696 domain-containing protein [Ruegeria pomeroyi]|nr:DUF3696 domain-containing protein [Ruegeria pomeroyi]
MRLTRIEIENFKGIGRRQVVELRPITLLFGPNSAGKSTVLHALHYAREIVERRNANADSTIAGGALNLGGFINIVHGRERDRPVRIRLVAQTPHFDADAFVLNRQGLSSRAELAQIKERYSQARSLSKPEANRASAKADIDQMFEDAMFREQELAEISYFSQSLDFDEDLEDSEFPVYGPADESSIESLSIELEVRWDPRRNEAFIAKYSVGLNDKHVLDVIAKDLSNEARVENFNFDHPMFVSPAQDSSDLKSDEFFSVSPLASAISRLSVSSLSEAQGGDLKPNQLSVNVRGTLGAVPSLDWDLEFHLKDGINENGINERWPTGNKSTEGEARILNLLLTELMQAPLRTMKELLSNSVYIGPLRDIPPRGFQPQLIASDGRWANGLGAWDAVLSAGERETRLLERVNYWLADKERLDTGYRFEHRKFRRIDYGDDLATMEARAEYEGAADEFLAALKELPWQYEVVLRDERTGIDVLPSEIGVGLSQLIPIIAMPYKRTGLFSIEQPELHVHPRVQVRLADLFISTMTPSREDDPICDTWLVETHSEHIMLRLKRRLRQTDDDELPDWLPQLHPEDLAIYFVEMEESGARFYDIGIDEEGEFTTVWPRGFFAERREELL